MKSQVDRAFNRFTRTGDPAALARVFDRTAPELLRIASHLVSDLDLAEDLVQSTFLAAIESATDHDPERPVLPWLHGILSNRARELRRKIARRSEISRPVVESQEPPQKVAANELTEAVSQAITGLPHPYRPVLMMHLKLGHSVPEIALVLGRAPGTVRKQLARGMEMLRKALPPGLTAGLVPWVSASGLDAMRHAVLRAAPCTSATAAIRLLAGSLIMKKILWTVCACVLVGLAWIAWPPPAPGEASSSASSPSVAMEGGLDEPGGPATTDRTPLLSPPFQSRLRGLVSTAGGAPLPGARVYVSTSPPWDDFYEHRRPDSSLLERTPEPIDEVGELAATPDGGSFELPRSPQRRAITVRAPGFLDETLIVEHGALLPDTLRFELREERSAEVTLIDRDSGRPVTGQCEGYAEVSLPDRKDSGLQIRIFEQRDSPFHLAGKEGQRFSLTASAGGYEPDLESLVLEDAGRHRIAMTPVPSISGTVMDAAGEPL